MRLKCGNIVMLAAMAVLPSTAFATTVAPSGTYTYDVSLPNGASFSLTQSGPLGEVGTHVVDFSFSGSPLAGYDAIPQVSMTGDNGTWTELQFQYGLPTGPGSNDPASILSYTFAEPDAFWAFTGYSTFPSDGVTSYNGLLYINTHMDGSFVHSDDIGQDFIYGTVPQGAWFDSYAPGTSTPDPQCTSCSVTTTFTPTVSAVPEPSSLVLLGSGVTAMLGLYKRRRG